MICDVCGRNNADDLTFCQDCGRRLRTREQRGVPPTPPSGLPKVALPQVPAAGAPAPQAAPSPAASAALPRAGEPERATADPAAPQDGRAPEKPATLPPGAPARTSPGRTRPEAPVFSFAPTAAAKSAPPTTLPATPATPPTPLVPTQPRAAAPAAAAPVHAAPVHAAPAHAAPAHATPAPHAAPAHATPAPHAAVVHAAAPHAHATARPGAPPVPPPSPDTTAASTICASCEADNPPGYRFCVTCGAPLRKTGAGMSPAAPSTAADPRAAADWHAAGDARPGAEWIPGLGGAELPPPRAPAVAAPHATPPPGANHAGPAFYEARAPAPADAGRPPLPPPRNPTPPPRAGFSGPVFAGAAAELNRPAAFPSAGDTGRSATYPAPAPPPPAGGDQIVGSPVVDIAATRHAPVRLVECARCHGHCVAGTRFCKYCGAPLEADRTPAPRAEGVRPGALPEVEAPPPPVQMRSARDEVTTLPSSFETPSGAARSVPAPLAPLRSPFALRPAQAYVPGPGPLPIPVPGPGPAAPRVARAPEGRLVVIVEDGSEGKSYPLAGQQVDVGRTEGDILLEDDLYVSPRHARLVPQEGGWILRDLGSSNRVYLRIRKPFTLRDGDLLLLGLEVLQFQTVSDAERGLGHAMQHGTLLFGSPAIQRRARLCQRTVEGVTRDVYHIYRDETVIGRETGDIVFTADPFLSRRHAVVRRSPTSGEFTVADLDSSNGTFVAIREDVGLSNGDFVRIGQHLFRVDLS